MKKILSLSTLALAGVLAFTGCSCGKDDVVALETGRLAETAGGDACAYNATDENCSKYHILTNLYDYLGRDDTVYIDLRDYEQYNAQHIEGFKMVQFFSDIYGTGNQLFVKNTNAPDDLMPRYSYSVEILETIFPKDKNIFLMCAAGSRVEIMMQILELNGWDMSKIHNVGGLNDITKDPETDDIEAKYKLVSGITESELMTGIDTETWSGHTYTTIVNLRVDSEGKITTIYVTGTVVTSTTAEWNSDTWSKEAYKYAQSLVGKKATDIVAMLGSNGASGADVVTGATLSSNRVLRAVANAFVE